MEIVNPKAEAYAKKYTSEEDQLSHLIDLETAATHTNAHMLSGHVQGIFLEQLSKLLKPKRILEIGTYTGYSALSLVKGLTDDGMLHTIELQKTDAAIASGYFSKSLYVDRIILHEGNALEIIPLLNEQWDLVFIDADKVNYINYYELTLPRLKQNGLIIADNVLFHGEVLEEKIKGKNAKAIDEFNDHVKKDNRTEQLIVTLRDGLSLIRKK